MMTDASKTSTLWRIIPKVSRGVNDFISFCEACNSTESFRPSNGRLSARKIRPMAIFVRCVLILQLAHSLYQPAHAQLPEHPIAQFASLSALSHHLHPPSKKKSNSQFWCCVDSTGVSTQLIHRRKLAAITLNYGNDFKCHLNSSSIYIIVGQCSPYHGSADNKDKNELELEDCIIRHASGPTLRCSLR